MLYFKCVTYEYPTTSIGAMIGIVSPLALGSTANRSNMTFYGDQQ